MIMNAQKQERRSRTRTKASGLECVECVDQSGRNLITGAGIPCLIQPWPLALQ